MLSQIKIFIKRNGNDIFIVLVVILVALIFFGIGRLTAPKSEAIRIENLRQITPEDLLKEATNSQLNANSTDGASVYTGKVVASKNSDKYHLPDCPGAKQISEKNKIWFDSIEAAEKAGYKPAANCPGLNNP